MKRSSFLLTLVLALCCLAGCGAPANGGQSLSLIHIYLGQVSVYDRNQQLLFSWSSSKEYILSVSMGSGGNLAVACVNAVDGRVTTVVYALNIHREEELSRTEFPGSLALQMRWEGSYIQLVCDDQVFALKKDCLLYTSQCS